MYGVKQVPGICLQQSLRDPPDDEASAHGLCESDQFPLHVAKYDLFKPEMDYTRSTQTR